MACVHVKNCLPTYFSLFTTFDIKKVFNEKTISTVNLIRKMDSTKKCYKSD